MPRSTATLTKPTWIAPRSSLSSSSDSTSLWFTSCMARRARPSASLLQPAGLEPWWGVPRKMSFLVLAWQASDLRSA